MSGRSSRQLIAWWCLAVLSVVTSFTFFTGLYCSDDGRYLVGVQRIVEGLPIRIDGAAERRLVFLLPGALAYSLSHAIDPTIGSYSLFSVGTVLLTALMARRLAGDWAGVAAGVLLLTAPVALNAIGALTPDFLSAMFFVGALLTTHRWLEELDTPHERLMSERWALLTGALAAGSVMAKESGVVLVAVPLATLGASWLRSGLKARELSHVLLGVMGSVAALLVEACLFRWFSGAWHSSLLNAATPHDFRGFMARQGRTIGARFEYLVSDLKPASAAILFGGAIAGVLLLLLPSVRRERRAFRTMLVVLWGTLVLGLGYFTVGTTRLSEWIPPVIQGRYYLPLLAPAAVLLSVAAVCAVNSLQWRPAAMLITAGIALFSARNVIKTNASRGTAYSTGAKETFAAARGYAAANHPELPIEDTPSGWTTDLQLCRQLMAHPDSRVGGALDERARHYPLRVETAPPFVLLGQGNFLVANVDDPYFVDLRNKVANDGWTMSYERSFVAPAELNEGLSPRQTAIAGVDLATTAPITDDPNATHLYLVRKASP